MKKFVSIVGILFLSSRSWNLDANELTTLHNLMFWPAFLGSVSLGLVILAWSWYEEARS